MNQTNLISEMSKKLILIENRGTSRKPVWVLTMNKQQLAIFSYTLAILQLYFSYTLVINISNNGKCGARTEKGAVYVAKKNEQKSNRKKI